MHVYSYAMLLITTPLAADAATLPATPRYADAMLSIRHGMPI